MQVRTHRAGSVHSSLRHKDISLSEYLKQEQTGLGVDEAKVGEGNVSTTKDDRSVKPAEYVPPYSSGDGSPALSQKERLDAEEEVKDKLRSKLLSCAT